MATPATKEIVLITGGNTGLGFEIAKALLLLNRFHIIIGSRDANKGAAAVQKLHNINLTDCSTIPLDITSLSSLTSAFEIIKQKHGKLDILHANAGTAPESYMPVDKTPISELIKTACDTNVAGTAQSIETFIPLLQKSENPRIVMMSTSLGSLTLQTTRDPRNWPAYAASKAALNMIMLVYYHQYPEMKINACAPGFRVSHRPCPLLRNAVYADCSPLHAGNRFEQFRPRRKFCAGKD